MFSNWGLTPFFEQFVKLLLHYSSACFAIAINGDRVNPKPRRLEINWGQGRIYSVEFADNYFLTPWHAIPDSSCPTSRTTSFSAATTAS
jgi:hypothetical protein